MGICTTTKINETVNVYSKSVNVRNNFYFEQHIHYLNKNIFTTTTLINKQKRNIFTEETSLKMEDAKIYKQQKLSFLPFTLDCGIYRVELYAHYNYNESLRNFALVSIVLD